MANYYLNNLRVLVGKLESSAGTMETLAAGDFDVLVRDPVVTPAIEVDDEASHSARGDHAEDEVITGAQSGQITFSVRVTTGPTVATEPKWWKFAKACGLESIDYTTKGQGLQPRKSKDFITMTLWVYDIQRAATPTAVCYKFAGCMGNVVFSAEGVGKPLMANFTFTGKLTDIDMAVANASLLVPATIDTDCAEKFLDMDAQVNGLMEKISSFSLDVGNEIQPVLDQSDATGYSYYGIVNRKPRLTMNPLMDTAMDHWGELSNGVTGCPQTFAAMVGCTGLDRLSIHLPKAQVIAAGVANREGLVNWDLTLKALANGVTGAVASGDLANEVTFEILQGARS